jgi:NAD(P)-dependent dehydrogenase (short-subunit alcohol dehydrogenase family)
VTDPAAVEASFASFGTLDVLFNNAGMSAKGAPIDEIPVETWLAVCNTNITGMFLCARAAFGIMRHQTPQGGRIINNGSISAQVPRPGSTPYTMSKHAVTGLTRTVGLDGRAFNIACGQIDIGNALTDMARAMTKGVPQADGRIAIEPTMDVAEVAGAVLHMASLPLTVNVPFMTIMARDMPYIGRG